MNIGRTSASARIRAHQPILMGVALFLALGTGISQTLRDPTLPPPQIVPGRTAAEIKPLSIDTGSLTIIVRDGRRYVVLGTRLYAQGQRLGSTRIERINETEVWFLEDGVVHKVSKFPGIQRHNVAAISGTPACAPRNSNSSSAAPCANAQP